MVCDLLSLSLIYYVFEPFLLSPFQKVNVYFPQSTYYFFQISIPRVLHAHSVCVVSESVAMSYFFPVKAPAADEVPGLCVEREP